MLRFALLHHKCGTTYVKKVLNRICQDLNFDFQLYQYPSLPESPQYVSTVKKFYDAIKSTLAKGIRSRKKPVISFVGNSRYNNLFSQITDPYKGFHVVRDPRDIIVSGYFSHLHSHPVNNIWGERYLIEHRKWLENVCKDEGLLGEIKHGYALNPMAKWNYNDPNILEIKFEALTRNPQKYFGRIFDHFDIKIRDNHLDSVIERYSFKQLSGGREKGEENVNNHFRKGVPGDWKNHFNSEHIELFKKKWGSLLIMLGYETDSKWGER